MSVTMTTNLRIKILDLMLCSMDSNVVVFWDFPSFQFCGICLTFYLWMCKNRAGMMVTSDFYMSGSFVEVFLIVFGHPPYILWPVWTDLPSLPWHDVTYTHFTENPWWCMFFGCTLCHSCLNFIEFGCFSGVCHIFFGHVGHIILW